MIFQRCATKKKGKIRRYVQNILFEKYEVENEFEEIDIENISVSQMPTLCWEST